MIGINLLRSYDFVCFELKKCIFISFSPKVYIFGSSTFLCRWRQWRVKSNLLPQFQRFISRLVPAILFQIEIGDNNGAGMTNHQQFILRLVPAISFQIEIDDNNGAEMTNHQQFILHLVHAMLFQIEISDNNGAGMANHQHFISRLVPQ